MARLAKEPMFAEDKEAAINMLGSRFVFLLFLLGVRPRFLLDPLLLVLNSHETMIAFLSLLEEKYGGAEGYLMHNLEFSTEDVATIRRNLVLGAKL